VPIIRSVAGLVENQPLLMLLATEIMLRFASVRVKDKASIYNDLRPIAGIGCIAGEPGQSSRQSFACSVRPHVALSSGNCPRNIGSLRTSSSDMSRFWQWPLLLAPNCFAQVLGRSYPASFLRDLLFARHVSALPVWRFRDRLLRVLCLLASNAA